MPVALESASHEVLKTPGKRLSVDGFERDAATAWRGSIGIDPQLFYDTLTRDLPLDANIHVMAEYDNNGSILMSLSHNGHTIADLHNMFSRGQRTFYFNEWAIHDARYRGHGLGSVLLENYIDLMRLMECDTIRLCAGRKDGTIYWSRCGARFHNQRSMERFNEAAWHQYQKYKDRIPSALRAQIKDILKNHPARSNIALSHLKGSVDGQDISRVITHRYNPECVLSLESPGEQPDLLQERLKNNALSRKALGDVFSAVTPGGPS